MRSLFRQSPELFILSGLVIITYAAIALFWNVPGTEVLTPTKMWFIIVLSFLFSTFIAIIAVIAGIGGGVLFTPVMLAFTSIDTLLIRATGLVVAMFSGLISTGPFMRKGLADVKIVFFCSVPIVVGAMAGAFAAIYLANVMGATGDAIVRLALGLVLVFIAMMFILGGSKTEYPQPKKIDSFSKKMRLYSAYWEESLGKVVEFHATRGLLGGFLFFAVGFTGGFFGLGGGWAVVPVLNLLMAVPLKVAAASSGVLLAMGNAAAIWPYITKGSLLPLLAVPWMLGQVVGGILGAIILVKIKAGFVRKVLIVILFLTSFKLIARGLEGLFGINIPVF